MFTWNDFNIVEVLWMFVRCLLLLAIHMNS